MSRSLSLVLPVRNVEKTLSDQLHHVMEVVSDLTEKFEVLLVDEGSTDQTEEVAHDLTLQYPQLRLSRRQEGRTIESSVDHTLQQTQGDVVLVHDLGTSFSPTSLRRAWEQEALEV